MEKKDIKSLSLIEMREWFKELGEKSFHANQVYRWLYVQKVKTFEEMTNLSKSLRTNLIEKARIPTLKIDYTQKSKDGTIKIRYQLHDGEKIETVLIPDNDRMTICVSSQVGCAVGCEFCFTAKMGIRRNLETSEIIDQLLLAYEIEGVEKITNIVFMGMGEPLNNLDNVIRSIEILYDDRGLNFSKKRVTVSTSGNIPNIIKLRDRVKARLAISLNASTNKQRDRLIPINKKWNIEALIETLQNIEYDNSEYITLEYVLIKDVNDSREDAKRLVDIAKQLPKVKVNVIPFNEHEGIPSLKRPSEKTIEKFHQIIYRSGVDVLLRVSRGDDIGAACGQLVVPELVLKAIIT